MTPLAAYLLLFLAVGVGFIFVHLVLGKLIRPSKKNPEKDTIYECGEPTIGSAWVQFDLRFYVVALLFVIFDVEVAFFFPWAEVFGKANAIRSTPPPQTAEDYKDFAAKVLDLAAPRDSKSGPRDRAFWEQVRSRMGELGRLTPEQLREVRQRAARFKELVAKIKQEHEAEAKNLVAAAARSIPASAEEQLKSALQPRGAGPPPKVKDTGMQMLERALQKRTNQIVGILEETSFGHLREISAAELELVFQPEVKALMRKLMPRELEAVDALVARQAKEVREAVAAVLAVGGQELWKGFTADELERLGDLQQERLGEIQAKTLQQMPGLKSKVEKARTEAGSLAWLALVEILVFFGVLLVGFAYLWRRGDLAWVRSTTAQAIRPPPTKRAETRELQPVGKGS